MRGELKESAELFLEMLKDEPDYQKYIRISDELEQELELARRVHAFRRRNYELQTHSLNPEAEMMEMSREYQELIRNPLVHAYFDAEGSVCRMLQKFLEYIRAEIRIPEI